MSDRHGYLPPYKRTVIFDENGLFDSESAMINADMNVFLDNESKENEPDEMEKQ